YLVALLGPTGARNGLSEELAPLAARVRRLTDVALFAGFGIGRLEDARAAADLVDRHRRLARGAGGGGRSGCAARIRPLASAGAGPMLESTLDDSLIRRLRPGIPSRVSCRRCEGQPGRRRASGALGAARRAMCPARATRSRARVGAESALRRSTDESR
ncbi:MAG: tryptophan synthase subunit alpha, partial [Chloroflexota bacterium]|nr:tryptophan synthase subunit alpha [Chloroflexota bacterium]